MSEIVITDLEQHFRNLRSQGLNRRTINSGLMRSAIVDDKSKLPENVRRRMKRTASNNIWRGGLNGMNVKLSNPTFYHPLFQPVNMLLPRDRRERNEWCRHFYRTEPIIATAIDLHTEYPISDFNNQCADAHIKRFFDYMVFDKLDIINMLLCIGHEYWKIGDVFVFGTLNEVEGIWERFTILNPDYINIQTSVFADDAIIELVPDEKLTAIVNEGPRGEYAEIYNQLSDEIIRAVKMNRNIRMDNRLISHIAHKASDYEIWGTPLMMRCFKTLIYKDKLRGAQDAIANRHIFPIRLAKLGTPGEPYPEQRDLNNMRDMLMMADEDPYNFIIYHYGIQLDFVGATGKILPLNTEFDFIQKELMNGLGINEALLNGQAPTYANAQVGMDALAKRYMSYRYKLESFIKNKIYKPIAEIQGFYEPANGVKTGIIYREKELRKLAAKGEMKLIIPNIRWQQNDLTSNQSAITILTNLQNKKLVSTATVHSIIGLDSEVEKKNLEKERGTVLDPDAPKNGPLPGDASEAGAPATSVGDDMPGDFLASVKPTKMTRLADFFTEGEETTDNNLQSSPVIIKLEQPTENGEKE